MKNRSLAAWKAFRLIVSLSAVALPMSGATAAASTVATPSSLASEIRRHTARTPELAAFYASRHYRPLWVRAGRIGREGEILLHLLQTADADGGDPRKYLQLGVREALETARGGSPGQLAVAEVVLSRAFAAYVRDVRGPREIGVIYGESALRPQPPSLLTVLHRAAAAPALGEYLEKLGWMHPLYAGLRHSIESVSRGAGTLPASDQRLLRINLERARILPAHQQRYILVDAAAARLTYYENGEPRTTMKVVIGTPDEATPMMVGMLRYATLNPYWHVPVDITRERIAPRVVSQGLPYFRDRGYEVVTAWTRDAKIIDPASIDWKAVADGRRDILVRQKPGPRNGMGNIKFQFPNALGIYLHDTPAKQLFNEDQRGFSAGCVRLEDANALKRVLLGSVQLPRSESPEQTIVMKEPVPLYITYLTAVAEGGRIVRRNDIYGRDDARLALTGLPARSPEVLE